MQTWKRSIQLFKWQVHLPSATCIKDTKQCNILLNDNRKVPTIVYGLRNNSMARVTQWHCQCNLYHYHHPLLDNHLLKFKTNSDYISCSELPIKIGSELVC